MIKYLNIGTPNYFRDNPAEKTLRAICKEERLLGECSIKFHSYDNVFSCFEVLMTFQ